MGRAKKTIEFDEKNAQVLTDMLQDPDTSESTRLQIINELNEAAENKNFFETMFDQEISKGACPFCAHMNYWLISEEILNQMGWISHKEDSRVKMHTNEKSCPEYAEACSKKKTTA